MPITPTNRTKNVITPDNKAKGASLSAVYGVGVYGYATYGVGTVGYESFVNRDKSPNGVTTIYQGSPIGLLLSLTYANTFTSGTGFTNRTKN